MKKEEKHIGQSSGEIAILIGDIKKEDPQELRLGPAKHKESQTPTQPIVLKKGMRTETCKTGDHRKRRRV